MSNRRDLILQAIAGRKPSRKGWIRANCPFCEWRHGRGPDKSFSFGIHVGRLRYECFRCGTSGKLKEPIDGFVGLDFEESDQLAALEVPEEYVPMTELRRSLAYKPAVDYVLGRGLTWDQIERWRIGAALQGRLSGRVIVPVLGSEGDDWLWYVARSWVKTESQRYLYPRGARGGAMWNAEALRVHTNDPLLVVEGVFDAFPHWPNAAACLGKPTDEHLDAIAEARRPVVMALDGDAWEEAWAISMRLRLRGQECGYIHLLPKVDPGVTPRDAMWRMAIEAIEA